MATTQRILGIDPGSRRTGYAVIERTGSRLQVIALGHIKTEQNDFNQRLAEIYDGVQQVIQTHQPERVAIEKVFVHANVQSALKLGHARGAALVATTQAKLPIQEITPREIKQNVVGYGNADKSQVQHMVMQLFNLQKPPQADAADALAIAFCSR